MKRLLASSLLAGALVAALAVPALAAKPVFTHIWLDGAQVRTLVPPAASPQEGTDPFFMVLGPGGVVVAGVAAVGPGDAGYHGGSWKVYLVSWNVAQYPLTSDEAITAAEGTGDVTVTRAAELDFLCPIQP